MRIADIDHIVSMPAATHSQRILQTAAPLAAASLLVVSGLASAAILAPFGIVAAHAASDPGALAAIAERPGSAALLVCGLAIGLGIAAVPLRAALARLSRRTIVTFEGTRVAVEERGLAGTTRWSAPTKDFKGIAHHVRATLSGPRHELILVHPDRSKDILLQLSARPGELTLEHFSRMLGLAEIPARELYGRRRTTGTLPRARLELRPAAA